MCRNVHFAQLLKKIIMTYHHHNSTYPSLLLSDPENSESDNDEPQTISAKRPGKKGSRGGKKGNKKSKSNTEHEDEANQPSSVIYLGHLPVGFEEREITVFLNQFGNVNRCRVSRSTKTGRSRGYAFVEFADAEVANIVANTMSGYFLLEKRLVCHVLPKDKVYDLMFTKPKNVPSKLDKQKKARNEVNKRRTAEKMKGITAKLIQREEMKRKKLASLGIDYDFPGYAASAENATESGKKKRKVSVEDEQGGENVATTTKKEMKTPKSHKKKRKKSIDETVEEGKEPDEAVADVETKSSKKKKKSKTPKKIPKKA